MRFDSGYLWPDRVILKAVVFGLSMNMNSNDKRSRFLTRNNLFDALSTTRLWSSTGLVVESWSNKLFSLVRKRLLLSLLCLYLTELHQECMNS